MNDMTQMVARISPNRRTFITSGAAGAAALLTPEVTPATAAQYNERGVAPLPGRIPLHIKGAFVVTMDPTLGILPRADLHIRDGVIVAVGPDLVVPDGEIIEADGMIVLPGFIETHWHMWNSLLRGLVGDDADNSYFSMTRRYGPLYTEEDTYIGTLFSLTEALNSGITTVHNWAHNLRSPSHARASLAAHDSAGLRARFGYGTPQGYPPDKLMDLEDLARLKVERFSTSDGLVTLGAALRGPQFGSIEACRAEVPQVRAMGLPISIHVTGNHAATEKYRVIQALLSEGFLGPDIQLIHAVHASETERTLLAATGTHVSASPLTEMIAGMGFSPFAAMMKAKVLLSVSIDTTALPTIPDMFAVMRAAVELTHAELEDSLSFTPYEALELATINGARDLGVDKQTGSLSIDKRADVIIFKLQDINMEGTEKTYVHRLVSEGQPRHIDTVIVDGRLLKRNGKLTVLNSEAISASASRASFALLSRGRDQPTQK